MLEETVEFLKRFKSLQKQDELECVYKCRTFLARLVERYLSNMDEVAATLRKDGGNSMCYAPLQFCGIFLREHTEVLLAPPPNQAPSTPPLTKPDEGEEEEILTQTYLLWFLGRTLALLGSGKCSVLHLRAVEQVHNILGVIRWRDAYLYGKVLTELVYILSDLVQITEVFRRGGVSPQDVARFYVPLDKLLKSLQKPNQRTSSCEVTISLARIQLTSLADTELMQLNVTKILAQVSSDLNKFCVPSLISAHWATLCCHLEYGDAPLKTESLGLLCTMMHHQSIPLQVEEYFIDCITALLQLLTVGCRGIDLSLRKDLERATASVYKCLVARGNTHHFLFSYPTVLCSVLSKMATTLGSNGISGVLTQELRGAISRVVCELQATLPTTFLLGPICKPQRNQLMSVFLGEIGYNTNLQYVVGPLVKSIMGELSVHKLDKLLEMSSEIQLDIEGTPKSSKLGRKRKHEESGYKLCPVSRYSHTYKVLKSTLSTLLQGDIQSDMQKHLDGVQTCVEIVTSCITMYHTLPAHKQLCPVFGKFSAWLTTDLCQEICGFLFRLLSSLATISTTTMEPSNISLINECVTSAVRCVGALVSMQDYADYDGELYQTFCWVVSLPWLLNDPSWIDLKPANSREVLKISSQLVEHLEPSTVCECLLVLAMLSKEAAAKWRVHVFKMALGDSNTQIKQKAVECFPVLLHQLGPNANHLVYDVIHPLLEENLADLHTVLAAIPGLLACVVSRKAVLSRCEVISEDVPLYTGLGLECTACDTSTCTDYAGSPRERPRLVDANMFAPFLTLVNSTQVLVKQVLIQSMRRMFGHIGVRRNNTATIHALNMALTLIQDPSYNVRLAFSEVVQYLMSDVTGEVEEGMAGTGDLILTKLREVFCSAQKIGNHRLQETVLMSIARLGRVSEGELLTYVIIHLLESMLSPVPIVAAVAHEQLKIIADYKKMKTQNLFMRCRQDVCKFLVEAMHDAQTGKVGKSAEDILLEGSKVLGFPDIKTFLSGTEKYIVPFLVSKGTPSASNLIKLIATQLSVPSRSKLLITNTKYVFSYLVRYKQKEADLQTAILYLQKETNIELSKLVRFQFQQVHNELLLHLSANYSQVFHGLKILSTFDEEYTGGPITNSEEMAVYLQPRLLGVLAHFDSQLLNFNVPMEEKRPALESLISIIRLMGSKIISGIRHKVMNTLRIGLQFMDKAFIEISCRAWNCFVRSLELPFLGQMLPQIVLTLLPLLKQLPKQVAEIFNYMIVENRQEMKSYFNDIYFLPEMPELNDANAVLKQFSDGPSSQSDFKMRLEHAIKGIQHDSLEVRLHALEKLKNLLQEQKQAFFHLVMENETADPVVSNLITLLLKGCREPDVRAQRLYVECLGHCGAIDPGRLELSTNNPKADMANFQSSIQDDNFAVALINEVVKSYLAATESRVQDCSAYALQALLSIYRISESSEEEHGHKLWRRFPEHIQEILIPLLTSKYVLANENDWSKLQKPIYCSKKGHTFKEWVSTWTGYLSSMVKQDSKPWRVFKSCSAVIKFDLHIALHLLPYVVLHVLQDGAQADSDEIYNEINEVLTQATRTDGKQKGSANFHHMSSQTIFSVLDYLTKWKHFRIQLKAAEAPMTKGTASYLSDSGYKTVNDFLDRIPQDKLAQASFSCKAYTRALMHFEQFLKNKIQLSKEELDFMQRLYVELDEPDGVLGVAAIRQAPPTLQEQILTYSGRSGCQIDLQTCYEQALQLEPDELSHHQGLLRCLMDLGHPAQALLHVNGAIAKRGAWTPQLLSYQVEAAYKLSNWTDLAGYVKGDKTNKSLIGRLLLSAKAKNREEFENLLTVARQEQTGPLSAASMEIGSYQRGYECIVKLHTLTEIEEYTQLYMSLTGSDATRDPSKNTDNLTTQWQNRLRMMQSSFKIQESVLSMRRTLLTLAQNQGGLNVDRAIGQSWLKSAKIAQKTGYLQTAYSFLLQACEYNLPEFCLQKAKWHWKKGEHDLALTLLKKEMEVHFSNVAQLKEDQSEAGRAKLQVYAKALLLYGRYSEETSKMESNAIVKQYREVIEFAPNWEDGYFYLGRYFDRIMTTLLEDKDDVSKQGEFVVHVVKNLGMSLRHGNQFIYQSLPRLLSLWLDFSSDVVEQEERLKKPGANLGGASTSVLQKNRNNLTKLNTMIGNFGKTLAPYQLFSAFSQLTSRICHAHTDVFLQLKAIIARLVVSFPNQALWMLMAVSKSSYQIRARRCREIFDTAKDMAPDLHKVIADYIKLTERLLELCEKVVKGSHTVSLTQHFRPLKRLIDDSSFSQILVPLQSSMTVALPSSREAGNLQQHNAFPGQFVYIKGFDDVIEILPSLQKPKKITMHGSDGRLYVMMCKPKDDLRKDCRLMEFNWIVNRFLRKDPESRKRSLHIRTYTVIPLNEECGLLEWVNNTSGLRHILIKLYKEKGQYTSGNTLQELKPQLKSPIETKLAIYKQKLLPRHPPVFGEWFLRTFPDPTSWFNARLAYAKTVAVMSMVGYILGLGDRHGENILFDSTNGDCVHVDFNCLFNRGETFEWPEKVPFRMTHNLIHAMGPLKLEGIYRQACEVTLRVMRKEIDPLMSVLKPFVYDPLVEWSKPSRDQRENPSISGEITNEQAKVHVQNIEQRIRGRLNRGSKRSGLDLSVEGHVNHLIQEATDEINLCQMYIGWAAYM